MVYLDTITATLSDYHYRARPMTAEMIDQWDLQRTLEFYRDRFADAGDFTFIFVGNMDLEVMRPLIERYVGGLPSTGREETWRDVGPDVPRGVIRKEVHRGIEPQSVTVLVWSGPMEYSRMENYALSSTADVLNILLREKIREELGGTYGVNCAYGASQRPDEEYSFSVQFGADPERMEELTQVIFQEIDSLNTAGPDPDYIQITLYPEK
jgi:zinc protease